MNCKHFGICGSCTLYETEYKQQLIDKKERVLGLLSPFDVRELEVFSAEESHYRAFLVTPVSGVMHRQS